MTSLKVRIAAAVISATTVFGFASVAAPSASAQDCNHTFGCTNIPSEYRPDPGMTQKQAIAWTKCLASVVATGVPIARAAATLRSALAQGLGFGGVAGFASCDFDAISGR